MRLRPFFVFLFGKEHHGLSGLQGPRPQILEKIGGEANIASMAHCATRLRLTLKDESKADKAGVDKLPGVITVMPAGGPFQVVIGTTCRSCTRR